MTYDAQDDARKSYEAAIEAKRLGAIRIIRRSRA